MLVGSWLNSASPAIAELMAAAGFDFLTVDAEHSPVDVPQAQQLFQAIRAGNQACRPFVRVPGSSYQEIKRYMDAGAAGIICPLVNSEAQAREVVRAVKYPPQGERGVGFCRDNGYGVQLGQRIATANQATFVCVQIEHIEAVRQIDRILSVPGVDAAFLGPYDLSASLGCPADFEHPDYVKAKSAVLQACQRHGTTAGIHVVQPSIEQARQAISEGYEMIAYSLDITMLTVACEAAVSALIPQCTRASSG